MTADAPARAPTTKKAAAPAAKPPPAQIGKPLGETKTKVNALYYGPPGTTKTTSGLSLARFGPVLSIDAEGGIKKEALAARGVNVDNIRTWPDTPGDLTFEGLETLHEQLRAAFRQDPHYLVGILFDSWTEIARRLLEGATAFNSVQDAGRGKPRASRWQTNIEDYGVQSNMLRSILRMYRDLPCHLILTALERRDQDENTGLVSYGPQLGPSAANDTMGLVDIVMHTSWQQVGSESFIVGKTGKAGLRQVKDRFGVLPPHMAVPTADRVVDYVSGVLTAENDTLRAEMREAVVKAKAAETGAVPPVPDVPTNEEPPAVAETETPNAEPDTKENTDAQTA